MKISLKGLVGSKCSVNDGEEGEGAKEKGEEGEGERRGEGGKRRGRERRGGRRQKQQERKKKGQVAFPDGSGTVMHTVDAQ